MRFPFRARKRAERKREEIQAHAGSNQKADYDPTRLTAVPVRNVPQQAPQGSLNGAPTQAPAVNTPVDPRKQFMERLFQVSGEHMLEDSKYKLRLQSAKKQDDETASADESHPKDADFFEMMEYEMARVSESALGSMGLSCNPEPPPIEQRDSSSERKPSESFFGKLSDRALALLDPTVVPGQHCGPEETGSNVGSSASHAQHRSPNSEDLVMSGFKFFQLVNKDKQRQTLERIEELGAFHPVEASSREATSSPSTEAKGAEEPSSRSITPLQKDRSGTPTTTQTGDASDPTLALTKSMSYCSELLLIEEEQAAPTTQDSDAGESKDDLSFLDRAVSPLKSPETVFPVGAFAPLNNTVSYMNKLLLIDEEYVPDGGESKEESLYDRIPPGEVHRRWLDIVKTLKTEMKHGRPSPSLKDKSRSGLKSKTGFGQGRTLGQSRAKFDDKAVTDLLGHLRDIETSGTATSRPPLYAVKSVDGDESLLVNVT